ncbi:MAG TPA: histidine phosphatase family protein [Candidatus Saccharimonadia bacterium]|nr:histidine phosphatase family protein [Candidatus Saccharimonadia bacterium]
MKIYVVRHGRTNYNDLDLCNSDPSVDVHLTLKGMKQAEALANKLKEVPIDHIFVSELRRTQQTAKIVNQFHHATIDVDPLLNDHRSGYEGRPASLLLAALDDAKDKWTAHFNGGESIEDMKSRMAEFLNKLKAEPYDAVLIVTSGWVIRMTVALIRNVSNEEAWKVDAEQGSYLEFKI